MVSVFLCLHRNAELVTVDARGEILNVYLVSKRQLGILWVRGGSVGHLLSAVNEDFHLTEKQVAACSRDLLKRPSIQCWRHQQVYHSRWRSEQRLLD